MPIAGVCAHNQAQGLQPLGLAVKNARYFKVAYRPPPPPPRPGPPGPPLVAGGKPRCALR
jgi:hypothetical protein